ncbi:MAG: glutathione synthase [Hyphomicrobiales bacterium]|nr:glutathione synthase [Hyphomicrobiales bacterium]
MKVAFQMEPLTESEKGFTNSLFFIEEAQKRSYDVWQYAPEELSLSNNDVHATARRVWVDQSKKDYYRLGEDETLMLGEMDVIFMRNHPPFDMKYLSATYMLERLREKVLFVNDPYWVRNCPEKLFPFEFPEFMPPTLITRDKKEIAKFLEKHGDVILKPPYDYYGHGVMRLQPGDENIEAIIGYMLKQTIYPLVFQKYLKEIKNGRIRVFFIDGEPVTARKIEYIDGTKDNSENWIQTRHSLSNHEKEMAQKLGIVFIERGLFHVGIDIIGKYLIEINTTCPGGMQVHNALDGVNYHARLWDAIEKRRNKSR